MILTNINQSKLILTNPDQYFNLSKPIIGKLGVRKKDISAYIMGLERFCTLCTEV